MTVPPFIAARRSVRAFASTPVDPAAIDTCIAAACAAPAPHHSRPWRWVTITTAETKHALADAMGAAWRADLEADGVRPARIDTLITGSAERLSAAPVLVVACITDEGLDRYPDAARQAAEHGMALLSLGAAIENFMLTATELGLATGWVAAPIFCPDATRTALELDATWLPQGLICVGYPDPTYVPRTRPPIEIDTMRVAR